MDEIDWVEWSQSESIALDLDRPIFFLIHKTWCGACGLLKKSFQTSTQKDALIELSKKFVMTNVEDDDEPEGEKYAPDGAYIPRLFFFGLFFELFFLNLLDKYGERLEVNNKKNYPLNAYYFPKLEFVIEAMKEALKLNFLTIEERKELLKKSEEEKESEETTKKAEKKENKKESTLKTDSEKTKDPNKETKKLESKDKSDSKKETKKSKDLKESNQKSKSKDKIKDNQKETKKSNTEKLKDSKNSDKKLEPEKSEKNKNSKKSPKKSESKDTKPQVIFFLAFF